MGISPSCEVEWIKLFVKFVNTRKCGAGLGVECSECKCLELRK